MLMCKYCTESFEGKYRVEALYNHVQSKHPEYKVIVYRTSMGHLDARGTVSPVASDSGEEQGALSQE
jgi:hypothetical protein